MVNGECDGENDGITDGASIGFVVGVSNIKAQKKQINVRFKNKASKLPF